MPTYEYRCETDGLFTILHRTLPSDPMAEQACPTCTRSSPRVFVTPPMTERQFYGDARVSLTEGFSPDAVPEARRLYPGHNITNDGDVLFRSRAESRKFLRRKGEIERLTVERAESKPSGQTQS